MKYIEFKHKLKPFQIFSIQDINKTDPEFDTRRLVEWQKKGYIKKIINRWYCFSDLVIDEHVLFLIANNIYSPSYVSFESALAYYHLIPEGVFSITSATSIKTYEFNTYAGTFVYRHLKPSLFFGYKLEKANEQQVRIAEVEKAILDFLYLNNSLNTVDALSELRINMDMFNAGVNLNRLYSYLNQFANKALENRVSKLMEFIGNA